MMATTFGNLLLLLFCVIPIQSEDGGSFYGGSISYKLEKIAGKKIAHVELITGWELGKGPCGPGCSRSDVNSQTNARRALKITDTGIPTYFGNFSTDYLVKDASGLSKTIKRDLNDIVNANYTEWVIAVSETAKWEQELMKFSFEMVDAAEDVNFDGKFWRQLNQSTNTPWHFQTKVDHSIRSDTGSMNSCPVAFTKSYYRVKLDIVTTIQIPMIDYERDLVICEKGKWIEGGLLPEFPGITVKSEDTVCYVTFNASRSMGYADDFWIAIPVTFKDFNKEAIDFGDNHFEAGSYALSKSNAQFGVQILEHLVTPLFVAPTKEGKHLFIVYAGSTWSAVIYAEAPINTTIDEFIPSGRDMEHVAVSTYVEDPSRDRVKFTTMSWTPTSEDAGQHILCIRAVDTTGVDTDETRCFSIEVRQDVFNHSSPAVPGKPYFVDIPSIDQFVNCKMGATCLIPIFVKSSEKVTKIEIVESYTDEASIGDIDRVTTIGGDGDYKTILSFTHNVPGVEKICLRATDDKNVTSETVCISSEIEYPDPCLSTPCQNSATCRSDKRSGTFICDCFANTYGNLCNKIRKICDSNPCMNGGYCYESGPTYGCYCQPGSGYEGNRCETNSNDCDPNPCNTTTGTCLDLVNGYKCDCFKRYSGDDCTHDNCEDEDPGVTECPADGCSSTNCSGHGVCYKGGACTCSKGFDTGTQCTNKLGSYPGVTTLTFVLPTPMDKSLFTCFVKTDTVTPCHIPVFVATTYSNSITWKMETTDDLKLTSTIEKEQKSAVLQGIDNVFSAEVVVRGTLNDLAGHYVCVTANDGSSEVELCLELKFVTEPKQDPTQNSAAVKFLEPTPHEGSIFVGFVGEKYTVILYTSNTTTCENVISTTGGVTVFPAFDDGTGTCVTEASFIFNDTNTYDIYFQTAKDDYQGRHFSTKGITPNQDPCVSSPCQNKGHCFPNGTSSFKCFCQDKFSGHKCEEGPCPVNNCQNEAYCRIYDGQQSCLCKAGYLGQYCEFKSSAKESELTFTGMAKPKVFQCVIYQPCSVALLLTGDTGPRPDVTAGYISPAIMFLGDINVAEQASSGSFQVDIGLKAIELGTKDVCIQSMDSNGVNKDELCFKVNVTNDVSTLYGFKDRPYFLYPSLPDGAQVECADSEPCHVIYHVTTGKGNEQQCISAALTASNEIRANYIFTSCGSCTPGTTNNGNCTVDVSINNDINDVGNVRRFCLGLGLINNDITGEERCFELTVVTKSNNRVLEGCQKLQCQNGGFCDGHIPSSPVCHCKSGFSGNDCSTGGVSTVTGTNVQSFLGNLAVPSDIRCEVGQTCSVEFKVLAVTGQHPDVSIGYSDPRLSVGKPINLFPGASSNTVSGYIDVHPSEKGTFKFCLQTNENSQTVEELCVTVNVVDATQEKQDESKPHFVNPTLPKDSTVLCTNSKPCHLNLYFTKGDIFGLIGKCPTLSKTEDTVVNDLHIFTPTQLTTSCMSDVGFKLAADETKSLCFQLVIPGKRGETRCFTVRNVPDTRTEVASPCTGKTCENGGKCVADLTKNKDTCVCSVGFSGETCGTVHVPSSLPGVLHMPSTTNINQHFDSSSGVPKNVKCDSVNPCCIVIPYYGDKSHTPLAGFKDDDIQVQSETVITPDASKPQLNHYKTCVQAPSGEYTMCYQTTTNGTRQGMNVDEICFEVKITPGGQSVIDEPKFTNTISHGSSVLCQPKSVCYIPVETNHKPGVDCEQVKECGKGVAGAHVFETTKVGDRCLTEVSLKTGNENTNSTLCISAGTDGEKREITVVTEKAEGYGPCQKLHCINGGLCVAKPTAYCKCQAEFHGTTCGIADKPLPLPGVKNISSTITVQQHFDGSSGVPKKIKCDAVNPCCIVIPYFGDKDHQPINGYVDSEINIESQHSVTPNANKPEFNHFVSCVKTSNPGTHKICYQTTADGTETGMNVDEICVEAEFSSGGQTSTVEPKFTNTLSNGSSVLCQLQSECYIPVETGLKGGKCEQVQECGSGVTGVYVFTTRKEGDKCITDVSIRTGDHASTDKLCISAGSGGEERNIIVETEKAEGYGPCQQLHCKNGGHCIANPTATCQCRAGFRGNACEIGDKPIPLPGVKNVSSTVNVKQHFDGSSGIPKNIKCDSVNPCCVVIPYHGEKANTPINGYFDNDIQVDSQHSVTPDPNKPEFNHFISCVKISKPGTHRMCYQTTADGTETGMNIDEMCVEVEFASGGQISTLEPKFTRTLLNGSSVSCQLQSTCHIPIETGQKGGECDQVKECGNGVTGVYVFPTRKVGDKCVTDVSIQTGEHASTDNLCLSAGKDGEKRNLIVDAEGIDGYGPCQKLHCLNHGKCLSSTHDSATCECPSGFNGTTCENVQCDQKEAKAHAESIVKKGYASCFCVVNKKKVRVIKKKPVPQKKNIVKAVGFGAGGMVGTMVIGIAAYVIISKVRKPPAGLPAASTEQASERQSARRPVSSPRQRVHPEKKPSPPKSQLNF